MVGSADGEPPSEIVYELDAALTLLATLEDSRDASIESGHLALTLAMEAQIRILTRKLGFADPDGGADDH